MLTRCGRQVKWRLVHALLAASLLFPGVAGAAHGYFLNGAGAVARGLAGAGVALARSPLALAANPASIARLPGDGWQLGVTFVTGDLSFEASSFPVPEGGLPRGAFPIRPGEYEHNPDTPNQIAGVFPVPYGAITWRLDEKSAVAIGVYGNGGLNNTYQAFPNRKYCPDNTPQRGVFCYGDLSSDIAQTFIAPTYARQVLPWLHVGASLNLVWQTIEIRGLGAFARPKLSRAPGKVTNNGHDDSYGVGAKFGVQAAINPRLRVGVAYQTRTYMTKFDDYAGLLADQGDFDVPAKFQIGLAWDLTNRWTLVADYLHIWFSEIPALSNPQDAPGKFGTDNGPGFGWRDIDSFQVGVIYEASRTWTFRLGYARNNLIISDDQVVFNILAAATFKQHIAGGLSYRLGEKYSLDLTFTTTVPNTVDGSNFLYPKQQIELHNFLYTVGIGIRRHFN